MIFAEYHFEKLSITFNMVIECALADVFGRGILRCAQNDIAPETPGCVRGHDILSVAKNPCLTSKNRRRYTY
jgi:hypothetical protein